MKTAHTFVISLVLTICLPGLVFANQGVLMVVKGDIQVERGGSSQKAKVGFKVQEGDVIKSGPDSRAKVVMVDKNVLNISPDSKIKIEKYVFNEQKDEKSVSLNVLYGKVRSTVKQKYDGEKNTFNVKTPSAVAGVRGTDFVTQFNQVTSSTKIVTFEGQVMAGSGFDPSGNIANAVAVNPGQFTVASAGAPPAPPVSLPKSELASMNAETNAEAPGNGSNSGNKDGDRAPGSEKSEGKEEGKQGEGNREPSANGGSSMGVDSADMTASQPNSDVGMGPSLGGATNCPTCGLANPFPNMLPPELTSGQKTNLQITIGQ
jgi:hypothetical protein